MSIARRVVHDVSRLERWKDIPKERSFPDPRLLRKLDHDGRREPGGAEILQAGREVHSSTGSEQRFDLHRNLLRQTLVGPISFTGRNCTDVVPMTRPKTSQANECAARPPTVLRGE